MREIEENGVVYNVTGDYPKGKYSKVIKSNAKVLEKQEKSITKRLEDIEDKLDILINTQ